MENRLRLRLHSLAWALIGAGVAAATASTLALVTAPSPAPSAWALLDAVLRSSGCGFFYGLLAFHLQRVDPDDGHLQAGLVGAVCGIRSLGAASGLQPLTVTPADAATVARLAPSLMMELVWAWLPLWLPLIGSALLLHGLRHLTPSPLPPLRP
jgi:hypothetical protein